MDLTLINDITSLSHCRELQNLKINNTKVTDLSPLCNCIALQELSLTSTKVETVLPLASCYDLKILILANTLVTDVSVLSGCTKLEKLYISNRWKEEYKKLIDKNPNGVTPLRHALTSRPYGQSLKRREQAHPPSGEWLR